MLYDYPLEWSMGFRSSSLRKQGSSAIGFGRWKSPGPCSTSHSAVEKRVEGMTMVFRGTLYGAAHGPHRQPHRPQPVPRARRDLQPWRRQRRCARPASDPAGGHACVATPARPVGRPAVRAPGQPVAAYRKGAHDDASGADAPEGPACQRARASALRPGAAGYRAGRRISRHPRIDRPAFAAGTDRTARTAVARGQSPRRRR